MNVQKIQNWKKERIQAINNRARLLSDKERKTLKPERLIGIIEKVSAKFVDWEEFVVFSEQVNGCIDCLPLAHQPDVDRKAEFVQRLKSIIKDVMKKYKLVTSGYYTVIWGCFGLAFGVSYGLMLKNLALGIGCGTAIGFGIGSFLDGKADKAGRVI